MEFFRIYLLLIFPMLILYLAGIALGGWPLSFSGLLLAVILNAVVSRLVQWGCEKAGEVSAKLYTGYSDRTLREQYAGYITQVRYLKNKGNFENALDLIEQYLAKDPNYSEALYLKAQILLEGFNDRTGARQCLDGILNAKGPRDCWTRWAESMRDELGQHRSRRMSEKS